MIRKVSVLLCALALSGCITTYPDLTQSRSPCRTQPGGWCDFVREAAAESYAYAMLSSNAYEDEDEYDVLPQAFKRRGVAGNDDSGLAYSVFDRFALEPNGELGPLKARVIAFRGTEFGSTKDVLVGSFGDSQINGAAAVFQAERAALDAAGNGTVPIEVTGHSLGGALATQISINNREVRAYVFNTSPFFNGNPMTNDTNRVAIAERDEFLRVLRRYKAPLAAETVVINCNPSSSAGEKHSIRKLADCLTWIAAYEGSTALGLLEANGITKPEIECGDADKVHPSVPKVDGRAVIEPCVHALRVKASK